jgi:DNA primase
VPKAKLSLGRVAGGTIRLADAAEQIIVCEGLEDGLTINQETHRPVWVAAGASMLPAIRFPACVKSVAIGGDDDDAGRAAARKAAEAFAWRGLRTSMFFPTAAKDFNQELMGAQK